MTGVALSTVSPIWQRIGSIALANIRAAEKVEEKSFGSCHVMQVVYVDDNGQQETAYLQCKVGWDRGGDGGCQPAGTPHLHPVPCGSASTS